MEIPVVTNKQIAITSSKGNQEKWYDVDRNIWIKLDQFGYEALSEMFVSTLLEESAIEKNTPFTFVRYGIACINAHKQERIGCYSQNFLDKGRGQCVVTLMRLFTKMGVTDLITKLEKLSSNKKRIAYLAEATAEFTGLRYFPQYLALLFEIDALFVNDDRHLNNIAVIEENGNFSYCPIFDNGACLLSNLQYYPMNIEPTGLLKGINAQPFDITFNRQRNAVVELYGKQLQIPRFTEEYLNKKLKPMLNWYDKRIQPLIYDRVIQSILIRQKQM